MTRRFDAAAVLILLLSACGNEESAGDLTTVDGEDAGSGADISGPPEGSGDDSADVGIADATTGDDSGPRVVEGNCSNGIDDDFDGNVDCADEDCDPAEICDQLSDSEFNCVDDFDNDGDGDVDCDDSECGMSPVCRTGGDDTGVITPDAGGTDAGVDPGTDAGTATDGGVDPGSDAGIETDGGVDPGCVSEGGFEWQCGDSKDNNCDGNVDCDDSNCDWIPPCLGSGGGGGGIAFEFQCDDGIDNDADTLIDCADDNCNFIPPCGGRP